MQHAFPDPAGFEQVPVFAAKDVAAAALQPHTPLKIGAMSSSLENFRNFLDRVQQQQFRIFSDVVGRFQILLEVFGRFRIFSGSKVFGTAISTFSQKASPNQT